MTSIGRAGIRHRGAIPRADFRLSLPIDRRGSFLRGDIGVIKNGFTIVSPLTQIWQANGQVITPTHIIFGLIMPI